RSGTRVGFLCLPLPQACPCPFLPASVPPCFPAWASSSARLRIGNRSRLLSSPACASSPSLLPAWRPGRAALSAALVLLEGLHGSHLPPLTIRREKRLPSPITHLSCPSLPRCSPSSSTTAAAISLLIDRGGNSPERVSNFCKRERDSQMDHEFDKTLTAFDVKASHIFRDFMTRITKIEELTSLGSQLLMNFRQELDYGKPKAIRLACSIVSEETRAGKFY
ncbi:hypothetical protein Taro_008259, partial [Colocasia esculenta]|nr:hypothetical protein [Colocasia esculenta]